MTRHAIIADVVFDGDTLHRQRAVVVAGDRIEGILPSGGLSADLPAERLPQGAWLAPGFIDVQVNGGGDVLFNEAPTPEGIARIAAAHRRFGTTGLLPTLITDERAKMRRALAAVAEARRTDPSVLGIHLEGPFISPERPGVHHPRFIRTPDEDDLGLIIEADPGVRLVTLAPERVPRDTIRRLACAGVRVSLGHTSATYDEARQALADGATGFTHLFNAMPPLASRAPGPIAAALESRECWYGLIVDGVHVHPAMLKLALRGLGRPMLVTDAMPPVGGTRATFTLYDQEITTQDGRCLRADGTLAGAALDMASAVRNCVTMLDIPLAEALQMASAHPADFLGLGLELGRIRPGYRADLVALMPDGMAVFATWVAGRRSETGPQG